MNQETINRLISEYSHIQGSKDFILLSYVSLSPKYKQSVVKRFTRSILNQEHFKDYISISNESLYNMIIHWENVFENKRNKGESGLRELFTYKALRLMLSNNGYD
jgi:hypothetical protein